MAAGTPIRIIAEATVLNPHLDEVLALLEPLTDGTRGEPGNLSYTVVRDTDDGNHILFLEEWADRAAFDAHLHAPHFLEYAAASTPLLDGAPRIVIAEPLSR